MTAVKIELDQAAVEVMAARSECDRLVLPQHNAGEVRDRDPQEEAVREGAAAHEATTGGTGEDTAAEAATANQGMGPRALTMKDQQFKIAIYSPNKELKHFPRTSLEVAQHVPVLKGGLPHGSQSTIPV